MTGPIARIPSGLRWILFLPVSLGAAFLVGGLMRLLASGQTGAPMAYSAAFLSGLAYVWAALYVAHTVAPSHKRIVVAVLGILLLGDLSVAHLILQTDLTPQLAAPQAEEGPLGVILGVLRAEDYSGLQNGGFVKVTGALSGCCIAWWMHVKAESGEPTSHLSNP